MMKMPWKDQQPRLGAHRMLELLHLGRHCADGIAGDSAYRVGSCVFSHRRRRCGGGHYP